MLKFELDLYWKRATYFWGFLAICFTAYFLVSDDARFKNKPELLLLVASVGLVCSFGWYLVGRGSRYWQNNWLFHIEALEMLLSTPVYQLKRKAQHSPYNMIGAYPFSVSKVHQTVCLFITLVWLLLFFSSVFRSFSIRISTHLPVEGWAVILLTFFAILYMLYNSRATEKPFHVSFIYKSAEQVKMSSSK